MVDPDSNNSNNFEEREEGLTQGNRLEIHNKDLHEIGSDICAMNNLTILKITGCKLTMVLPELGLLSLSELHLKNNLLGFSPNWDWLKGKPLMNSLRELDLSINRLKFFPPQLVKYEKLVSLNVERNELSRLPFGIRRMRSLRTFAISRNMLVSLPSTFFQMDLELTDIFGNIFLSRKEHHFLAAVLQEPASSSISAPKPINNNTLKGVPPLWLKAARVVCDNNLAFSYETLPTNLVDLLLEFPVCYCGKLCDISKIYERAVKATYPSYIYQDIVLCGKYCSGIVKAMARPRQFHRDNI